MITVLNCLLIGKGGKKQSIATQCEVRLFFCVLYQSILANGNNFIVLM